MRAIIGTTTGCSGSAEKRDDNAVCWRQPGRVSERQMHEFSDML